MFNPFRQVKILPVLVLVLALALGVRMSAMMAGSYETEGFAFAEEVSDIAPQAGDDDEKPPEEPEEEARTVQTSHDQDSKGEEHKQTADDVGAPPPVAETGKGGENWRDSMDEDLEYSKVRMELFEDLSNRRTELEKREKEMNMREALLKAAEQELDQKYKELLSLREEIQVLLKIQSKAEKERIESLVKIYEGMKAKDAARIFNTLDMDVLLSVLGQMSERKSAPIIAAMTPERARTVTIMLAEQKSLPDMEERLRR